MIINKEKLKSELVRKYEYVKFKNVYELIESIHLLKELDVLVLGELSEDEYNLRIGTILSKNSRSGVIYDGGVLVYIPSTNSWRTQSHFMSDTNTVKSLRKDVEIYNLISKRESISDEDRKEHDGIIYDMYDLLTDYCIKLQRGYYSEDIIRSIRGTIKDTFDTELRNNHIINSGEKITEDERLEFIRSKNLNKIT